eukprot:COSAG05_NODE_955_length_6434_cov_15.147119_3_plen_123_part_00
MRVHSALKRAPVSLCPTSCRLAVNRLLRLCAGAQADEAGLGAYILKRAGIDTAAVSEFLQQAVSGMPAGAYAYDGRSVTFSQPFVDFLKRARKEQRAVGDTLLGVDHVALALCGCSCAALKE